MRSSATCSPPATPITTPRSARWPTSTPPAWPTCKQWFTRQLRPEQCGAGAGRRHQRRRGPAAGREVFRRDQARPGQRPAMAACRPLAGQDDRDEGPRRRDQSCSRTWAVPGMLDEQTGGARPRRLGARRARQLAARQCAGARREAGGAGLGRRPAVQHRVGMFQVQATVQPGRRSGAGREAARRDHGRLHRQGPDRRRSAAAPRPAKSPARIRGLEQVGGFGGKAVALAEGQLYAGDTDFYSKQLDEYARGHPGRRSRPRCSQWLTRPAAQDPARAGRAPGLRRGQGPRRRSQGRRHAAAADASATIPPVGSFAGARLPGRPAGHPVERHGGQLRPAHRGADDPVALSFDAGYAADAPNQRGLQA